MRRMRVALRRPWRRNAEGRHPSPTRLLAELATVRLATIRQHRLPRVEL